MNESNSARDISANGKDSIYAPVIKSIRDFLENIPDIEGSVGGAIIFFQKKNESERDLMMQVFPFKSNILTVDDAKCKLQYEQKVRILERINKPKPYHLFWHFNQFKNNNGSDDHCFSAVPAENIISYNAENIGYHIVENEVTLKKTAPWPVFFEDMMNGFVKKNTYEQLLFESGCKSVSFIPIPVLSTPSILLVLNHKDLEDNKRSTLQSLYYRSRDTVDSYLYSRLLDSLGPLLETEGSGWEEVDLVYAFVKEICNIILPISFTINEDSEIFYYKQWPTDGFASTFTLPLLDGKYNVVFRLTSFQFIDLETPTNKEWDWIHNSKVYKSTCYQSSLLLCKLFNLMYNNWKLIKAAERRAYSTIVQTIDRFDIESLDEKITALRQGFDEIKAKDKKLNAESPSNYFDLTDDRPVLVIDGQQLIGQNTKLEVAQRSGFLYLRYILKKANEKRIYKCDYNELYLTVDVPKPKNSEIDLDVAGEKGEAFTNLTIAGNDLCEHFRTFWNNYSTDILWCLKHSKLSKNTIFNNEVYFIIKLLDEFNKYRSKAYFKAKKNLSFLGKVLELGKLYKSIDPLSTAQAMEAYDVSGFFVEIVASKAIVDRQINYQKEFVRQCFQSMIRWLRGQKKHSNLEQLKSLDHLIANLITAGLIQSDKDEPKSQTVYTYDQRGIKNFIKWNF